MPISPDRLTAALPGLLELDARALIQLGRASSLRAYRPKETLYRAGDRADGLYIVLSGRVIVRRESAARAQMLHTETTGGVLGEIPIFGGGAFPASATALETTQCAHVPIGVIHRLIRDEPTFARFALRRMAARAESLLRRIDDLTASTVTTRLAGFIADRAAASSTSEFRLGVTQSALADELGTAREVVVRGIATLVNAGAIRRTGRSRFGVQSLSTLHALAGR
jgi:CRP/FNR family transcriptional regulator